MSQSIQIETDVLIIGGGAAGAQAALKASEAGLKTTMVVKGLLGKSGCSILAGSLNYWGSPDEETEGSGDKSTEDEQASYFQRTMAFRAKYTHYLGDQEYMRQADEYARESFFSWIEQQGMYLIRDEHGVIVSDEPGRTQAWLVQMGMSGTLVMDLYRKLILARDEVLVLEQTTATRLLTNDGEVVGAAALDFVNGKLYIIHARVVILATGHSNHLSERTTATREGAGTGWVIAYEAGCRLQNIEMQWYHASDVAYPATWMRLHLYPNPLPGTEHRSRLYNDRDELFYDSNWMGDNPVPYIMQLKHLIKEVKAGRARVDGGYYSSYRHVEPEVLEKWFYQSQFMKKIGVDLRTETMENGITWHLNVGGVHANGETMETHVPGLLVAGSISALVTSGIPNAIYDGTVAARTALERAERRPSARPLVEEQVAAEQARVLEWFRTRPEKGLLPGQVKKRIRQLVWQKCNLIKSEATLQEALDGLRRIEQEDMPRMRLQTDTTRFNYDWVEALDVMDMLQALKLELQFSLYRKESRGAFYREDFPYTDNENWLVQVTGSKGDDGQVRLETQPVDLVYVRPEHKIVNYFDVDY